MEVEHKHTKGGDEVIRHWKDSELRDIHHEQGKAWRSDTPYNVVKPTVNYRNNYDNIFKKKKCKKKSNG